MQKGINMYTIEEVCNKLNVLQSAVHNELKRISKDTGKHNEKCVSKNC